MKQKYPYTTHTHKHIQKSFSFFLVLYFEFFSLFFIYQFYLNLIWFDLIFIFFIYFFGKKFSSKFLFVLFIFHDVFFSLSHFLFALLFDCGYQWSILQKQEPQVLSNIHNILIIFHQLIILIDWLLNTIIFCIKNCWLPSKQLYLWCVIWCMIRMMHWFFFYSLHWSSIIFSLCDVDIDNLIHNFFITIPLCLFLIFIF